MKNKTIPVFFAVDDNYVPYLAVTLKSITDNASKNNFYEIYVLTESLSNESVLALQKFNLENFSVNIVDLKTRIEPYRRLLENTLRDYYSVSIFYRLFIASLFPNLKKAIYIDSDIILNDDIANLYSYDLTGKILGVIVDEIVSSTKEFKIYTEKALGVPNDEYFNSGVLLMNLEEYRLQEIERKFLESIQSNDLRTVAPDQDYLNVLCKGKVKYLPNKWDKMPLTNTEEDFNLLHYNMYLKPWHYDECPLNEYFWHYAKKTDFYRFLQEKKNNYSNENKIKDKQKSILLLENALKIAEEEKTFRTVFFGEE